MMDDSPEGLEDMWQELGSEQITDRIVEILKLDDDGVNAKIGELTLEVGMHLGEVTTLMLVIEVLSKHIGDAWGTANAKAIADALQGWRDQSFDLVGDNYPPLA